MRGLSWVCVFLLGLPFAAVAAPVTPASLRAPAEEEHHPPQTPTSQSSAALEHRRESCRREQRIARRVSGEESPQYIGPVRATSDRGHRYMNGLLAPLRC